MKTTHTQVLGIFPLHPFLSIQLLSHSESVCNITIPHHIPCPEKTAPPLKQNAVKCTVYNIIQ